jgi:hypothetical protein
MDIKMEENNMTYNENLKVFAACYVAETDISDDNKLQLINYIKNSSSKHIEHLLCTGYMKESLTDEEKLLEVSSGSKAIVSDPVEIDEHLASKVAKLQSKIALAKKTKLG